MIKYVGSVDLTQVGLIVLGVGVALIVIAFLVQLAKPSGPAPTGEEGAAPQASSNPLAAILDAVAGVLKALGDLLKGTLGMFSAEYRPGVFLSIVGGLLAIVGTFV